MHAVLQRSSETGEEVSYPGLHMTIRGLPLPEILPFELLELVGGEDHLDLSRNILNVPKVAVERPEQGTRGGADDEVGSDSPLLERLDHPEMAEPRGRSSGQDLDRPFSGSTCQDRGKKGPFQWNLAR
jgi:hypothetical protein